MTEPSPVNADQACQANQDCNYSIAGQICLDNKCTFFCTIDSDCISNGKCISEKCDWSGEPVPPLFLNSTLSNLDTTNSSEKTTANKLSSPLAIAIVVVVAVVVVCCLVVALFFCNRRKRLAESSRGLKPLQLSGSRTSLRKSKRDSRERERERSSKKFQHDDDIIGPEDEKEEHEDLFTPAAGTHRPPQRSQTMYGTSTPSTVELNVGYPTLGQQHHFMQQEYMEMERDDQQQQQQEEEKQE
ncbi:unnamed protein product [Rhizophagus irregularis]|nr:unnamed protein product [Rhizophagus irregularis]